MTLQLVLRIMNEYKDQQMSHHQLTVKEQAKSINHSNNEIWSKAFGLKSTSNLNLV